MALNSVLGDIGESTNNSLNSFLFYNNWSSSAELVDESAGNFEQGSNLPELYSDDTFPGFVGNESEEFDDEYVFDRLYVRVIFIVLYTIVFCFCFLGNLMVILVVTLHWRMRNVTKFCLANLAFADLCVGLFCVYQNLSVYLIQSWVLGEVLCKMYHFINALSHTSSVLILVVICVERYLAILHPFKCKQILTKGRLRVLIAGVWLISAVYCSPRLYYVVTTPIPRLEGGTEIICTANRQRYDSGLFDMIHFFLLFVLPLVVITILYTCVGITLWNSTRSLDPTITPTKSSSTSKKLSCFRYRRAKSVKIEPDSLKSDHDNINYKLAANTREAGSTDSTPSPSRTSWTSVPGESRREGERSCGKNSDSKRQTCYRVTVEDTCYIVGEGTETQLVGGSDSRRETKPTSVGDTLKTILKPSSSQIKCKESTSPRQEGNRQMTGSTGSRPISKATDNSRRGRRDQLKSRKTVVRMMIVIVVSFAFCNFPVHLRKLVLYWSPKFDFTSHFSTLATPVTQLIMYLNCAINPMIYAFMSKTFRSSFLDLLCCRLKRKHDPRNNRAKPGCVSSMATHVNKHDDGEDTD